MSSGVRANRRTPVSLIRVAFYGPQPDYHMFGLGDQDAGPGEAPVPSPGLVGVGKLSFLVGTGGDGVRPAVRLEHWRDGLPESEPGYEAQETFELYLPTGELILDLLTFGGDSDFMTLPTGIYTVRVTAWERESTRLAEHALYEHDVNATAFEQAREALHGRERYLIQFALKRDEMP